MSLSTRKTTNSFKENNSAICPNRGCLYCQLGIAIALGIGGAIASSVDCAIAQIVPDATLGAESSVVTPQTPGSSVDLIQGGATRGANLFHSFEQFSILTGREAFFNNSTDIQNIISRVTGAFGSNIEGLIRANGTANLFLINPNGIIFGPNASLSIGGSFVGSTASSVNFTDGSVFSATAPQTTPLLTVNIPVGLQYGGTAGGIVNQSRATNSSGQRVGLQVLPEETLVLLGGDVRLDGGFLSVPGGRVELGGVAGPGTVGLNVDRNELGLTFPASVARSDVSLTNSAEVNVASGGGGSIAINAQNVDVLGESGLRAGISLHSGSVGAQAGDITLNATGAISIENSFIYNAGLDIGNGGNLSIDTEQLLLRDGVVTTSTLSEGHAGDLTVNASESVELTGSSSSDGTVSIEIFSTSNLPIIVSIPLGLLADSLNIRDIADVPINLPSGGIAGNLTINTGQLIVWDGPRVSASARGNGRGGTLAVFASEFVDLIGTSADGRFSSGLFTQTQGFGDAGDLRIATGQLSVLDKAQVTVSSLGSGNAGNLEVEVNSIRLDNQGQLTAKTASGSGGNIVLQVQDLLQMRNNSLISAEAGDAGNSGNIDINTDFLVAVPSENSDIVARAIRGGNIQIKAESIFGIEFRDLQTPVSDIPATGEVELITPDIDPNQGLVALPAELVDVSNQIAAGCAADAESVAKNEFIITGRGGLPPSPTEPLKGESVLTQWATLEPVENRSSAAPSPNPTRVSPPTQIVEANGWTINNKGEIILTANAPTVTPHSPAFCTGS